MMSTTKVGVLISVVTGNRKWLRHSPRLQGLEVLCSRARCLYGWVPPTDRRSTLMHATQAARPFHTKVPVTAVAHAIQGRIVVEPPERARDNMVVPQADNGLSSRQ